MAVSHFEFQHGFRNVAAGSELFPTVHSRRRYNCCRGAWHNCFGGKVIPISAIRKENEIPQAANRVVGGVGVACLLLIVLWVRSYWLMDELFYTTKVRSTRVDSNYGKLLFATEAPIMTGEFVEDWGVWTGDAMRNAILPPMPEYSALGFSAASTGTEGPGFAIGDVTWFPVIALAASPPLPAYGKQIGNSLRTLLIATTLVAVVLGLIVWLR